MSITAEMGIIKVWSERLKENDTQDYVNLWIGINNWVSFS